MYIEGKLQTRSWEDQSGQKKYTTEIVGTSLNLLGGKPEGSENQSTPQEGTMPDSDDIPF